MTFANEDKKVKVQRSTAWMYNNANKGHGLTMENVVMMNNGEDKFHTPIYKSAIQKTKINKTHNGYKFKILKNDEEKVKIRIFNICNSYSKLETIRELLSFRTMKVVNINDKKHRWKQDGTVIEENEIAIRYINVIVVPESLLPN